MMRSPTPFFFSSIRRSGERSNRAGRARMIATMVFSLNFARTSLTMRRWSTALPRLPSDADARCDDPLRARLDRAAPPHRSHDGAHQANATYLPANFSYSSRLSRARLISRRRRDRLSLLTPRVVAVASHGVRGAPVAPLIRRT
jgi:hypothetical protein